MLSPVTASVCLLPPEADQANDKDERAHKNGNYDDDSNGDF